MTDVSPRPEEVSAADWAEQLQDADPVRDEEQAELAAGQPELGTAEVDEGDLAEQLVEVFVSDEE